MYTVMNTRNNIRLICIFCAFIAPFSSTCLASEFLYRAVLDQSLGRYKLEKKENNHIIHFEQPLTGVEFIFNKSGKLESVIPVSDQEKILLASMLVLLSKITDDEIGIDDGWKAHKIMFGNNKIMLNSFIGSMSNFQLGRPNARGFVVPKNGELVNDYSKLFDVDKSKLINDFTSKIEGDDNNVLIDVREIFHSWHSNDEGMGSEYTD